MAIEVFSLLSWKIGEFLLFEDRRKCIEAHRCFEHINDSNEYHHWDITESNIISKKYLYLKKYKPRIKILKINIKTIVKIQDIIEIKNISDNNIKIILDNRTVPEINHIFTEAFDDICPANIHFSYIKQENDDDTCFYKLVKYQVDKCKLPEEIPKAVIEISNIKEFINRFTEFDGLNICNIYIKNTALYKEYTTNTTYIFKNCKKICCCVTISGFHEFFYNILTYIYDATIITMNESTLNILQQYINCSRLEIIYFRNFYSQSIIIGNLINTIKLIPAKTFVFWHKSLLDPSLYIVIKALLKENKEVMLDICESNRINDVCCGLLIYRKCILHNLKVELSISTENASYATKKNDELLDLIEDEHLKELFQDF